MKIRRPGRALVAAALLSAPVAHADPPPAPAPAAPPSSTAPAPAGTGAPAPIAAPQKKAPPKPLVATVLPGVQRVLGYPRVKPYEAPTYPAVSVEPSDIRAIEITEQDEAPVLPVPTLAPLLGAIVEGGRVPIKGTVHAKNTRGCPTKLWYAVDPFGYVCSKSARPTDKPPSTEQVLKVPDGERLPYRYFMVQLKEGDFLPLWSSLESAEAGEEPERKLERGDTVAVLRTVPLNGEPHHVSVEGKVFPARGTFELKESSAWHGETLDDKTQLPFGWVTPDTAKVYEGPAAKGKGVDVVARRTRVAILEESGEGGRRMVRIGPAEGPARWLRAADVNEVRRIPRPDGITPATQWIDVDLGEQVLVAYEGDKPVFATLTSSGRAIPTPRGNYPVWAKVSAISMKSQPYEDKAYFVNKVPWVLFFQAHNAIHGAYWHDRFGVTKSHGCVNVAPLDARHLFEWLAPPLPPAWTGYRAPDLMASPTVHVRNSHVKKELVQERPIGPPDKALEQQKLDEAEERRAQGAAGAGAPAVAAPAATAPAGMQP